MKDKIILITGSTDGIGKQTALDLSEMGAHIIIHGRNHSRVKQTVEDIFAKTGNKKLDYFVADLSSLDEVRNLSKEIHARYKKLDMLINNAGVYMRNREFSHDGYEMTFAVNHLAHFLLIDLLLDLIKKSNYSRIINVASMAHASEINFDNLQHEKFYDGYSAYALSKLCNILFTYELAERILESNITVNCLHPGVISTKLLHAGWGFGGSGLQEGSKTLVYLATSQEVLYTTGKYFVNCVQSNSSRISYNREKRKILWELSEKMV
ncbi:MAG: SDR family oxidoreductase, partial [Bacteroidales bacterium]|nr:SDR family oxidoreductase [Bacteroidales bacterium]